MPRQANGRQKKGRLTIQGDEAWSFVGNKDNKQWIWLAIDEATGAIVGVFIGRRSRVGARGLWRSLPPIYRQYAVAYTDFWETYKQVIPSKRHPRQKKRNQPTASNALIAPYVNGYRN